jgi:hypothetical protein
MLSISSSSSASSSSFLLLLLLLLLPSSAEVKSGGDILPFPIPLRGMVLN